MPDSDEGQRMPMDRAPADQSEPESFPFAIKELHIVVSAEGSQESALLAAIDAVMSDPYFCCLGLEKSSAILHHKADLLSIDACKGK